MWWSGGVGMSLQTISSLFPQTLVKKVSQEDLVLETLWQSSSFFSLLSLALCSFGGAGDSLKLRSMKTKTT